MEIYIHMKGGNSYKRKDRVSFSERQVKRRNSQIHFIRKEVKNTYTRDTRAEYAEWISEFQTEAALADRRNFLARLFRSQATETRMEIAHKSLWNPAGIFRL